SPAAPALAGLFLSRRKRVFPPSSGIAGCDGARTPLRTEAPMTSRGSVTILDPEKIDRTLSRIAHEILEKNKTPSEIRFVGIMTRGVPLAHRLAAKIKQFEGVEVPVGMLDINLYRDDVGLTHEQPVLHKTEIPFRIEGKKILLV